MIHAPPPPEPGCNLSAAFHRLTRRGLIAAVCGAGLRAAAAAAQDAPPPLIVGVLSDSSGPGASVSGPPLVHAVQMAIQDTGLLPDGRPLSLLQDNFVLKPEDALSIARRWFDHGVSVIVDIPGTSAAMAVQALAAQRKRSTLITGSIGPELTGRACSPLGSCWTVDSASMANGLVKAVARGGSKSWFLVVPDTVPGVAVEADVMRAIEAAGGRVAGRSRHPAEDTDYGSIVAQAKASGATAIGLCDTGRALSVQLGQIQDGGLFADGRSVVAFVPALSDIHAAGAKAAHGLLLADIFFWNQNEYAKSFSNRFYNDVGQMPNTAHAAAYVAVRHYIRAVVATETIDAVLVNEEMRGNPVYFFGRTAHLRLDGRLIADLALLRVKPPDAMHGDWDHYEQVGVIPASDAYPPVSQTGCRIGA
jgi:branched-chain amino acid transport system substrate-binding protein